MGGSGIEQEPDTHGLKIRGIKDFTIALPGQQWAPIAGQRKVSVNNAYDNAMAESFFATLERELLNRRSFHSQAEAKMAVFEYIEGWYNTRRRHSALGYRSPVNYERAHARALASVQNFCRLAAADCATG